MARALTASVIAELQAATVRPILLFRGEFSTGTLRAWTGIGDLTWNSQTWTGVGSLAGISVIEESQEVAAKGISVSLDGISATNVSLALSAARQGKPCDIWLGFLNASGAIIADPYLVFRGRLDVPAIEDGGETATITISYESRLIDLERPRGRRYTHEDLQLDYAGDLGLEYVALLADQPITWGTQG